MGWYSAFQPKKFRNSAEACFENHVKKEQNQYSSDLLFNESNVFDIRQLSVYKLLVLQHKNKIQLLQLRHN
nr:unnamed protein product [Callosobruchus chinensis]